MLISSLRNWGPEERWDVPKVTHWASDRAGARTQHFSHHTMLSLFPSLCPWILMSLVRSGLPLTLRGSGELLHKNRVKTVVCFLCAHGSSRQKLSHSRPSPKQRSRWLEQLHSSLVSAFAAETPSHLQLQLPAKAKAKASDPPQISHPVARLSCTSPEYFYQTRKTLLIQYIDSHISINHSVAEKQQHDVETYCVQKKFLGFVSADALVVPPESRKKGHMSV